MKNQNGFWRNQSPTADSDYLSNLQRSMHTKFQGNTTVHKFLQRKMNQILLAHGLSKEIVTAIMMRFKNTKAIVPSPNGDSDFFDTTNGILQGNTLVPYLFIICLDYILQMSDLIKENSFTLKKQEDEIPQKLSRWSSTSYQYTYPKWIPNA